MQNLKRKKQLNIRFTNEEYKIIREKMKLLNINNLSKYGRKMLIDGLIIESNNQGFDKVAYELNKIGTNINQVVKRINTDNRYDKKDGEEIRKRFDEIWQLLRSTRSARP